MKNTCALLLALGILANAQDTERDKVFCALQSAGAATEIFDTAVYIMASIARCEDGDVTRCEVNIAGAVESLSSLGSLVVKSLHTCGGVLANHPECQIAASEFSEGFASIAGASGGIVAKCPNDINHGKALDSVGSADRFNTSDGMFSLEIGKCIVNIKDSVFSIFRVVLRTMSLEHSCEDPYSLHCGHSSLEVLAALGGLGEYLAGTIGKCSPAPASMKANAQCGQMTLKLVHGLDVVAKAGLGMMRACPDHSGQILPIRPPSQRLFQADDIISATESEDSNAHFAGANTLSLILVTLVPITAVFSFVAGRRLRIAGTAQSRNCVAVQVEAQPLTAAL